MKTKTIVKTLIGVVVIGGGIGYFMYQAMQSSWSYYYWVDEFSDHSSEDKNTSLRVAGRVKQGTVARDLQKIQLTFTLAGASSEVPVLYKGTIPDNFAEGKEPKEQPALEWKNRRFSNEQDYTGIINRYWKVRNH